MKDILKSFTDSTADDEKAEPTGEVYRPFWRSARPLSLDICAGPVQFTISYSHIYLTLTATEFHSAFWLILPYMTFVFEGERLGDVVRALGEREVRALYLFNPEVHLKIDEKRGRILTIQPVLASSDVAFAKAAETFGIDVGRNSPPES